jgi:outer membrane protein
MKYLSLLAVFVMSLRLLSAQPTEKWDLRKCVEYAMKNNISVKQADVQARISALQLRQAKLARYPNVSMSSGLVGVALGRSIDQTTNVYSSNNSLYQNASASGSINVYNWGKLKNNVSAAEFNAKAALSDINKAATDVALNVAMYYLNVLSAKEQIHINEIQVKQTSSQLEITRKQVDAGALPELNLAQVEAQLATDSSSLITSHSSYDQNVLSLKGLLNIDAAKPFDVETPAVEDIPMTSIADLQPAVVFQLAMHNQPLQLSDSFRIKAAEKNILVSKASLYPTISFSINLSTSFYNSFKQITGITPLGYSPITGTESVVDVGGTKYYVQSPLYKQTESNRSFSQLWQGWGSQVTNNFGQGLGFSLNIPIFNNGQYRIAYEQSKLNYRTSQLQKEQDDQTLKLNIYTAYTNAVSALQSYYAGKKSVTSSQKAYDFAVKRYDVGLLGTLDLLTTQNNLLKAKLQQLDNAYNYVFRIKVLEFYKGEGLKL